MNSNLIIDVGVHKGEDTEFYLKKGFNVVGIEANPVLYEDACVRFADHVRTGRLILLNVAISETDEPVTFYLDPSKTEWGTTSPNWADRNAKLGSSSRPITVQGRQFQHVLREFGVPYYLKVDIEGADLLCIQALHDIGERPRYLSIESTKTSWKGLRAEFRLLRDLGYSRFKVVDQLTVEQQRLPRNALEGCYVDHHFPRGASGAFGDEAPGRWLCEKEALRAYRMVFLKYRLFGDAGIIRGFNWNRPLLWRLAWLKKHLPQNPWYDTHAAL